MPPAGTFTTTGTTVTAFVNGTQTVIANDSTCPAGQGWYWSPSVGNPQQIKLCPATCTQYGTSFAPPTVHVTYKTTCPQLFMATAPVPGATYTGTCPAGSEVQWRWLAYNTADPPGTSVDFYVQTGAMPMPVKVSTSDNMHQVCALGMGGGCPIDLVAKLDNGLANGPTFSPTITVSAQLNPNGLMMAAPSISQWQVEYSCPDSQ